MPIATQEPEGRSPATRRSAALALAELAGHQPRGSGDAGATASNARPQPRPAAQATACAPDHAEKSTSAAPGTAQKEAAAAATAYTGARALFELSAAITVALLLFLATAHYSCSEIDDRPYTDLKHTNITVVRERYTPLHAGDWFSYLTQKTPGQWKSSSNSTKLQQLCLSRLTIIKTFTS